MSVHVLEAAVWRLPFTLEGLKARLSLTGTDAARDAALEAVLEEVTSAAERVLERPLARQKYREELEGGSRLGRLVLTLARFPVDVDSLELEVGGVAVTDAVVRDRMAGELWRAGGWPTGTLEGDGELEVVAEYRAGYVMPGGLVDWAAEAVVELGQFVRPASSGAPGLLYEVTEAGELGLAAPAWPTLAGEDVADGTATLTARDAVALPAGLAGLLYAAVAQGWSRRRREPGLVSLSADGFSAAWSRESADVPVLSPEVVAGLAAWRWSG